MNVAVFTHRRSETRRTYKPSDNILETRYWAQILSPLQNLQSIAIETVIVTAPADPEGDLGTFLLFGQVGALGVEHFSGLATRGTNLRFYFTGWRGNQFVSTVRLAELGKLAGVAGLAFEALVEADQAYDGEISPTQFTVDLTIDALALYPPFTPLAVTYDALNEYYPGGAAGALAFYGSLVECDDQYAPGWGLKL